ncbi:hypothetical protein L6452_36243 [Arctium lappa]|uniref:Uncharacterized protein n=1 Tax=Arctium lappa TaxID=4217 RepID=A0ACB8Y9Z2_ARCLA|nr:hypothetical protein L6452_36243 [Arctium lappa]
MKPLRGWEPPKSPTKVRSFLGLAGYYRKFIQDFSRIVSPLTTLTKKSVKFEWKEAQELAFNKLKERLKEPQTPIRFEGVKDEAEEMGGAIECLGNRAWVPMAVELQKRILEEDHKLCYSVHPGTNKMYRDLRQFYWWPGMKKDIAYFLEQCLTCLKVKAEHQRPYGELQPLEIPMWKWENITIDFVTKLPRTPKGFNAIWVIVDCLTKSAHFLPTKEAY